MPRAPCLVPLRLQLLLAAALVASQARADESDAIDADAQPSFLMMESSAAEGRLHKSTLTYWVCHKANESSGFTLEPSPFAGLTGCSLALVACSVDAWFFPMLINPWVLFVHVLFIMQYHLLPIMFGKDGHQSEFIRNTGKAGIIFQIYYADGPGQFHSWVLHATGIEMTHYAFVMSLWFVFMEAVVLHGTMVVVRKWLGTSKGARDFAELRVNSDLKGPTRLPNEHGLIKSADSKNEMYYFEFTCPSPIEDIVGQIPGLGEVKPITLYVEQYRENDDNKMHDVMWPLIVFPSEDPKRATAYIPSGYLSLTGDYVPKEDYAEFVKLFDFDRIFIFYKDKNGVAPFKNVYMCVPQNFRRCLLFFFVQFGLMMYYIYYLNNDTDTKERPKISVVKWTMALVITCISGEDESGSQFDWYFWRRMFVNLRDPYTEPKSSDTRPLFWFIPTPLWVEWRLRQFMDFLVNSVFRAILLGTAPILLCVEEPMDFIKDVLAIFFIVKLDDYDEDKTWDANDVVSEALQTNFISLTGKRQEHLPDHVKEKHIRQMMYECGIGFMYQSPDEDLWVDLLVDMATYPIDFVQNEVRRRPVKMKVREILGKNGGQMKGRESYLCQRSLNQSLLRSGASA